MSQRLLPNVQRSGLVAATELLPMSGTLAKLIRDGQTEQIPAMQQRGKALGLLRLDDSLAELVRTERVSLETATFHAESPDGLAALVGRKAMAPATGKKA
jgi:twitching motility protein PilT